MDEGCQSSGDSTSTTTISSPASVAVAVTNSSSGLRHLNKISHKIAKPSSSSSSSSSFLPKSLQPSPLPHVEPSHSLNPNQNQPPVYNITKNDFRDLVQKLTGSPAHQRISNATPPIHPPTLNLKAPSTSRLHRIRPPPLLLGIKPSAGAGAASTVFARGFRPPPAPLSPLPPLPTCQSAAESPISAYMRLLHSSSSAVEYNPRKTPGFPPLAAMNPQMQNQGAVPVMSQNPPPGLVPSSHFVLPPPWSPVPFGWCFPSPKSPCPPLSPNLLFSSTGTDQLGYSQLPVSPNVLALPSPR